MKKSVLILLLALLFSNLNLKAQYNLIPPPDSSQYDLLYIFDTTYFSNCFSTSDTHRTHIPGVSGASTPYSETYRQWRYYAPYYKSWCDTSAPIVEGYVIGATSYNNQIYAEAFAQDYYLDQTSIPYDNYVIVGVAIKVGFESLDDFRDICILDDNFDTISRTIFNTFNTGPSLDSIINWNRNGWNTYYFQERYYASLTNLNSFKIAFDVPKYSPSSFNIHHTCNVYSPCLRDSIFAHGGPIECGLNYDTIYMGMFPWNQLYYNWKDSITGQWYSEDFRPDHYSFYDVVEDYFDYLKTLGPEDNIPLCSFPDEKHLRRNGEWIRFNDDPAYTIWQNIYINMVPIIMIPSNTQSLSEVELEKMCYLMPNPASDYFKVMSHYTINNIQVFDMVGKLLIETKVNHFEKDIDISNLSSGTYIVKINTAKGSVKKKLIVE